MLGLVTHLGSLNVTFLFVKPQQKPGKAIVMNIIEYKNISKYAV